MRLLPFSEAADAVKDSLDIVDIVSRHVVLKKAGRNYLGLCPFHNEKTPSFNVNREKNLFKCFGCGEAGDALSFLMKKETKTYGEVIRELAEALGIEIRFEGQDAVQATAQLDLKQKILTLNHESNQWFQGQLRSMAGEETRAYLANRNMSVELIGQFGLGLAPPGWENLSQHLMTQLEFVRQQPDILVTAGLANPRTEGQGYYDRFRNRLIIPIADEQGKVVAFGGRVLSPEDKPKYLNSPETAVYVKSRILYGLSQAKDSIRATRTAIVMEGYFDVISAHWAGMTQTVGSCGTALTDSHLKLLSRFGAETVYLAFDSDEAGLNATLSALALLEPYLETAALKVKIIVVPSGKDPDDFVHQFTDSDAAHQAFQQLLETAESYLGFKLTMALRGVDTSTAEGRVAAAGKITPILAKIRQPVLRSELLREYARQLGIAEEALSLEIRRYEQVLAPPGRMPYFPTQNTSKQFSKKQAISKTGSRSLGGNSKNSYFNVQEPPPKPVHHLLSKRVMAERYLLQTLLMDTVCYETVLPMLSTLTMTDEPHSQLLNAIQQVTGDFNLLVRTLSTEVLLDNEPLKRILADLVFAADTLKQQLGWEAMPLSSQQDWVRKEAQKTISLMEIHRQKEHLIQLNDQAKVLETNVTRKQSLLNSSALTNAPEQGQESTDNNSEQELSLVKLQYQIREQL